MVLVQLAEPNIGLILWVNNVWPFVTVVDNDSVLSTLEITGKTALFPFLDLIVVDQLFHEVKSTVDGYVILLTHLVPIFFDLMPIRLVKIVKVNHIASTNQNRAYQFVDIHLDFFQRFFPTFGFHVQQLYQLFGSFELVNGSLDLEVEQLGLSLGLLELFVKLSYLILNFLQM